MKISVGRVVYQDIDLNEREVKEIVKRYIKEFIIGNGAYLTSSGHIEHWESWPHGSGTTTERGEATPLQIAAWQMYELLD